MKSPKFYSILFVVLAFPVFGQQETVSNQFWNNYAHLNTAFTGLVYKRTGGLSYRNQWTNLDGNPQNIYGFFNTLIKEHHGAGIDAGTAFTGNAQESFATLQYSYQMLMKGGSRRLSFGVGPTYRSYALGSDWVAPDTPDDPSLPQAGRYDHFLLNAGLAFSGPGLIFGLGVRNVNITDNNPDFNYVPHYYGQLSYKLSVNRRHELYLEGFVGSDLVYTTAQIDARLFLWNKLSLVAGYLTDNGPVIGAGWDMKKKYRGMYTLMITGSGSGNGLSSTTHEFSLVYLLNRDK